MMKVPNSWITLLLLALFLAPVLCQDSDSDTKTENPTPTPTTDAAADAAAAAAAEQAKKDGQPSSAFIAALSTIIVSELGDKTFFIAAIMAMRYNRIAVLAGAIFALFLMTAISTAFGTLVTALIPRFYTHVVTTALFFFFGFKLLYDAYHDEGGESNEKSEVEMELNQLHSKMMEKKSKASLLENGMRRPSMDDKSELQELKAEAAKPNGHAVDIESSGKTTCVNQIEQIATKLVFWQALTLTFLGEWGDRSQISTIALAANNSALIVFIGAFLGHCLCTSLAVLGGKFLAKSISEKRVNTCGGVLFLIFAIHNIFTYE